MCDPVTIAAVLSATMGIATAVTGFQGQQAAAEQAQTNANINFSQKLEGLSAQGAEAERRDSEASFDRMIEFARAQGRIATGAAEQGLSSTSIGQQLQTSAFETGREGSIAEVNSRLEDAQRRREIEGADRQRNQIVAANQGPSPLSLILGIAGGVSQGASIYAGGQG